MRRTLRQSFQAASSASAGAASSYDIIVVGGGLTGCLVGARLAMDNLKVLVIEEGSNISKQPKWYRQIGCALHAHRFAKRGYETLTTTVAQRSLYNEAGAEDARQDTVDIPSPRVLGGSGIMGSRSWFFGDAADWTETPLSFRDDLMPRIQRLEALEVPQPHRGKHGKFTVTRSKAISPFYRPFTEAMNTEMSLISNWNRPDGAVLPGCGRPETLIDPTTLTAHQTLDAYVGQALGLKRPLDVRTDTRVVSLVGNGKDSATGVRIVDRDGSMQTITSSVVVLAAGSIGSAKIVDASQTQFSAPIGEGEAGKNFWDCPSVALQFKSHDPIGSHHCYMNPVVQHIVGAQLHAGTFPIATSSSYDDVMALWSSTGTQTPDVKILIQPFVMNTRGDVPAGIQDGFQVIVELARPTSRGVVSAGHVDPNYFDQRADREALQRAVAMVKNAMQKTSSMSKICDVKPFAETLQSRGVCGGSLALGKATDATSQLIQGTSNVYCCDSSVLPKPLIGDRTPFLLALGERFVDKYLNKAELSARVDRNVPVGPGETRIVY